MASRVVEACTLLIGYLHNLLSAQAIHLGWDACCVDDMPPLMLDLLAAPFLSTLAGVLDDCMAAFTSDPDSAKALHAQLLASQHTAAAAHLERRRAGQRQRAVQAGEAVSDAGAKGPASHSAAAAASGGALTSSISRQQGGRLGNEADLSSAGEP